MQTLTTIQDSVIHTILNQHDARVFGAEVDNQAEWAMSELAKLGYDRPQAISAFSQAVEMASLEWEAR
jgi:hypothetical protein